MSSTEQENFKRLKKLVFQVGLPLLRQLFIERYNQNHGTWEETPEFGSKILKMLDEQNNSKEAETLKKYEERQHIQSGKVSKWDYTILQTILTQIQFDLDLENPSASKNATAPRNHNEMANKRVHILTQIRNKLAHEYFEQEKIPTEEFNKLWSKSWYACLYLGAEESVMNDIYPSFSQPSQNYTTGRGRKGKGKGHRSRSGGKGYCENSGINSFGNSSSSCQPKQWKTTTTSCKIQPSIHIAPKNINTWIANSDARRLITGVSQWIDSTITQELSEMSPQSAFYHFLFLAHGIFLLIVSSLFLARVSKMPQEFPYTYWISYAWHGVFFGALRVILSITRCLLMPFKNSSARKFFVSTAVFSYGVSVLAFGMLAISFILTSLFYTPFLDPKYVEGKENYNLYSSLILAFSIEPVFFTFELINYPTLTCFQMSDALLARARARSRQRSFF